MGRLIKVWEYLNHLDEALFSEFWYYGIWMTGNHHHLPAGLPQPSFIACLERVLVVDESRGVVCVVYQGEHKQVPRPAEDRR